VTGGARSFSRAVPSHSKIAEGAGVACFFALLAIAASYPLVFSLRTTLASDLGDPLLVSWMLGWDADRLRHGLAGVWDAPNFFPYRHTLLYSEHFLGVAIFTAPLQWLTGNPVLVYNLAFLMSFVVTACGMYVLARALTGRWDAALVAAIIFAFHPFRASHTAHLQLLIVGWLPLSVWALHRYFRTRRLRDLLGSTVFFLIQALTSGYFAYFGLVPLVIVAAYELWRARLLSSRDFVQFGAHFGVAAALAVVVMFPVVSAYWQLRQESGLRRPLDEITSQSADVGDYASASPSLYLWGGMGRGRGEHELFPGLLAMGLALVAVKNRPRSGVVGLYTVILTAAFVLSLGREPHAFGQRMPVPGPYALWLRVMPGLDGIRVPARLAIVCQMALAVLAAYGAIRVIDRFGATSRAARISVVTVLLALVAAEGWARFGTPAFDYRGAARDREGYAYLKSLPKGGAIELPTQAEQLLREFDYQYMTLVHGHPIVNGHSGYVTPLATWLRGGHSPLRETGRQRDSMAMLRSIGVKYVVVHRGAYEDRSLLDELLTALSDDTQVIARRDFDDITIATLVPWEGPAVPEHLTPVPASSITARVSASPERIPFLFDGDPDSRWLTGTPQAGDEWVALDFDRSRDIALVRLQLGARSFGDYPRELAIDGGADGQVRLFRRSVLPEFARGVIVNGDYPHIDIALSPNQTRTLTLRQLGAAHTFFWSIHEMAVFER
jgi:hypothetical protein